MRKLNFVKISRPPSCGHTLLEKKTPTKLYCNALQSFTRVQYYSQNTLFCQLQRGGIYKKWPVTQDSNINKDKWNIVCFMLCADLATTDIFHTIKGRLKHYFSSSSSAFSSKVFNRLLSSDFFKPRWNSCFDGAEFRRPHVGLCRHFFQPNLAGGHVTVWTTLLVFSWGGYSLYARTHSANDARSMPHC